MENGGLHHRIVRRESRSDFFHRCACQEWDITLLHNQLELRAPDVSGRA
jgi:hypothetical protein